MRWTLVALAAACQGAGAFPTQTSQYGCVHAQECDEAAFADAFGSLQTCLSRERHLMEDVAESAEQLGCEFDRDEAAECLDMLENAPCETFDLQVALTECGRAYGCVQ